MIGFTSLVVKLINGLLVRELRKDRVFVLVESVFHKVGDKGKLLF